MTSTCRFFFGGFPGCILAIQLSFGAPVLFAFPEFLGPGSLA